MISKKFSSEQLFKNKKMQNSMLILNLLKKLQKIYAKKLSTEQLEKNGLLVLLLQCAKVLHLKLFCVKFFHFFSTDLNSALNFAFYDTRINFFQCLLILIANLKPKSDEMAQKNEETYLYIHVNVSQNSTLHLSPVWEAPFCKKKGKIVVPQCIERTEKG